MTTNVTPINTGKFFKSTGSVFAVVAILSVVALRLAYLCKAK